MDNKTTNFRKDIALVMITTKGEMTLVQRKALNVLLANAADAISESADSTKFSIPLPWLKKLVAQDQSQNKHMKDSVIKLQHINVFSHMQKVSGYFQLVKNVQVDSSTGKIHYELPENVIESLKKQLEWVDIDLLQIAKMKSKYAIALYELALSENYPKKISLESLRSLLDVSEDRYPMYANFKQRILTPAINEVNTLTNITIELKKELKENRKVATLHFNLIKKDSSDNPIKDVFDNRCSAAEISFLEQIWDKNLQSTLSQQVELRGINYVLANIRYTISKQPHKNSYGYLLSALKDGYAPENEKTVTIINTPTPASKTNLTSEKSEEALEQKGRDYLNMLTETELLALEEKMINDGYKREFIRFESIKIAYLVQQGVVNS